jgi:pyridinium-3,5-bisthiocarboxylic acid mononucleotide nickel chelatase
MSLRSPADFADDHRMPPSNKQQRQKNLHAHFDCFSGAAGDMLLAACLDAAADNNNGESATNGGDHHSSNQLLKHVAHCLEEGLPELKGEFQIVSQRVTRGMGSIAGMHVHVKSKYNHHAAPVPTSENHDTRSDNHNHDSHEHESGHHDHSHDHDHGHSHSHHHSDKDGNHHDNINNDKDFHLALNDHDQVFLSKTQDQSHDNRNSSHSHGHEMGPLRNLVDIRRMLQDAPEKYIPKWVKDTAIEIFTDLAHAEAKTHGASSIDAVHFHEVGAVDSIVDTVGTVLALHELGITSFSCSRLPLGEGTVWTSHGILPVPAPATLRLMVGIPVCQGPRGARGELVTPTGAAILRVLTKESRKTTSTGEMPLNFTVRTIGIGAGTKDFKRHPNILRLIIGDT